jgi:hypothetical protein
VADRIRPPGEFKFSRIGVQKIVLFNLLRVGRKILVNVGKANTLDGPANQRWNIRMLLSFALSFKRALHIVGSAAFALRRSNQQVIARNAERAGIPLGGDEVRFIN